jgi:hypothetical protein
MELDVQVSKLRIAKTSHQNAQFRLQDKLRKELPVTMNVLEKRITKLRLDTQLCEKNRAAIFLPWRYPVSFITRGMKQGRL